MKGLTLNKWFKINKSFQHTHTYIRTLFKYIYWELHPNGMRWGGWQGQEKKKKKWGGEKKKSEGGKKKKLGGKKKNEQKESEGGEK